MHEAVEMFKESKLKDKFVSSQDEAQRTRFTFLPKTTKKYRQNK